MNGFKKFPAVIYYDDKKRNSLLIELKAETWKGGDNHISYFAPLRVYEFGDTEKEALEMLSEHIEVIIEELKYKVIFKKTKKKGVKK